MCEQVEAGAETRAVGSIPAPARQPDGGMCPASHPVSLGDALDNLLAKLESRMNENGITKP